MSLRHRRLGVLSHHVLASSVATSVADYQKQFDRTLTLPDGRTIGYADYGPDGGVPVIMCHGGPGCRIMRPQVLEEAQSRGIRFIAIDRPGYGLSTLKPDRSINDWATQDGISVADALGLDRFIACGISTGGSYSLCLAANFPDRVVAVVTGCAMSDMRNPEAAAGMPDAIETGSLDRPAAISHAINLFGEDGTKPLPPELSQFPPADMAVLAEMLQDPERAQFKKANDFANGVQGYVDDRRADSSSGWSSFDVSKVTCPVIIVHGESDSIVPKVHASITKGLVPQAEVRLFEGLGHLSIFPPVMDALDELARKVKPPRL